MAHDKKTGEEKDADAAKWLGVFGGAAQGAAAGFGGGASSASATEETPLTSYILPALLVVGGLYVAVRVLS